MLCLMFAACCLIGGGGCGWGCYCSPYGCYGWPYDCYGGGYPCLIGAFPECYDSYDYYGGADYGYYGGAGYGYSPDGTQQSVDEQIRNLRDQLSQLEAAAASRSLTTPAQASVVVALPKDASFFIDDKPWTLDPANNTFRTPALEPGYRYTYVLRAEVKRDGKTLTETRRVSVLPGQESKVEFTDLLAPRR